ncbi:MAG: acyl-CoA dehydrogenase family protein, partial [Dehalococcoidia bacterium]
LVDELIKYTSETRRNGKTLNQDAIVRHKLAEFAIECEVGRLMCYNIASMEDKGLIPDYQASMGKNFCAELGQRLSNAGLGMMGLYGQMGSVSEAPIRGMVQTVYLFSVGDTIGAGTSEINRTVIATRGLGLPRN